MFKQHQGAFQIDLVLIQTSRLTCVGKSSLHSEHVLVPEFGVVDVLLEVVEKFREGHFGCFAAHVVIQGRFE